MTTPDTEQVQAGIIAWIQDSLTDKGLTITPDTKLIEGAVLDSMHLLQLVTYIEEQYGVAMDPDLLTPENFDTPATIVGLVEQLSAQGTGA